MNGFHLSAVAGSGGSGALPGRVTLGGGGKDGGGGGRYEVAVVVVLVVVVVVVAVVVDDDDIDVDDEDNDDDELATFEFGCAGNPAFARTCEVVVPGAFSECESPTSASTTAGTVVVVVALPFSACESFPRDLFCFFFAGSDGCSPTLTSTCPVPMLLLLLPLPLPLLCDDEAAAAFLPLLPPL